MTYSYWLIAIDLLQLTYCNATNVFYVLNFILALNQPIHVCCRNYVDELIYINILIVHWHVICHVLILKFGHNFILKFHPWTFIIANKHELAGWPQRLNSLHRIYLHCRSFASIFVYLFVYQTLHNCSITPIL